MRFAPHFTWDIIGLVFMSLGSVSSC
uniref:Uncharacterized protein n=1 Tax=Anguilla anguilla TaxID=7936 RepID=A0A0E9T0M6_ANGAN